MADFPTTLKISLRSQQIPRGGRSVDFDADGLAAIRKLHPDRFDHSLILDRMSSADVTTLLNHYAANGSTFNFLWPPNAVTYVQKYADTPRLLEYKKGFSTYEVKLLAG